MKHAPSEQTVVLSGELRDLIGELEEQAKPNTCHGVICDGPAAISSHLVHSKPNAVGLFLKQGRPVSSLNEVSSLCQENDIPILLVCESSDLNIRLEAIRSGYPHVFGTDTPNTELVAHLVSLTQTHINSARE